MRAPAKTVGLARAAAANDVAGSGVVLWRALRKGQLAGLRFRRQRPIGPYILDFYCASARLAIEVDGFAHDTDAGARRDERRRAWLAQHKVTVLRFRATDVLRDEKLEGVLLEIERVLAIAPSGARCAPSPPQAGEEPES